MTKTNPTPGATAGQPERRTQTTAHRAHTKKEGIFMKHYLYTAEDDFRTYIVVAPNQKLVKKLIKEIDGCPMCDIEITKKEIAPEEFQRAGAFVSLIKTVSGIEEQEQAEQQTADNQTTEQAEDTAEQPEEQASKPTGKPKTYREIIDMIIQASGTDAEVSEICAEIDRAFQREKIKLKEYNQIYALINKFL